VSDHQKTSNLLGSALLCVGLLLVFSGERVFGQDLARQIATGFGGLLLIGACGLRARAFQRAHGDVRGVEGRILIAYLCVLAALGLYAISSEPLVSSFKFSEETQTHFVSVLSVLWPAVLVVALSAVLFMELVYASMPIAASVELRRVRTAAYAGLTLAFSVVFLLSINYVATARDVRRDLSYFRTTQPSAGTLRMVEKLESPVRVVLFWRKNDDVLQQIEPYFAALAHAGQGKHFTYEVLDSVYVPELSRKHRVNGNGSVLLLQGEGEKEKGQTISIGTELTEARTQLRKLDGLFQQSFTKLSRPERSVAMTVGHAERNATRDTDGTPGEGVRVMNEVWRRLNIKTSKFGAGEGLGADVPADTGAVMVIGPIQKFLPEELQTLITYVRQGGRLLVMLDPDTDDGLAPLLEAFGLARQPGVVASEKNHLRRTHSDSDHVVVFSNKYSSHPTVTTVSRFQSEVASIFVSGAGLTRSTAAAAAGPKPTVTFPLRSGPGFFRDLDGDFTRDANEPEESVNLVAAVTVTEKPGAPEGRLVVIGDGDFMTDKVSGNNGNVMLFVDSLAWLIGNEELNASVSTEEDVPIEHSRAQDKLWFYATTFAMPLPLLGLAAWVARRRRRPLEAAT
jgi:hypothetical protein